MRCIRCTRAVYALRRQGSKKMDADIKILADKIIRCPEQEWTVDSLAAQQTVGTMAAV